MHVPYSTVLNFSAQHTIHNCLDKFTENSEWTRPPAFLAEVSGNLVDLAGIVASTVEVFFHGLGIILASPLEQNKSEKLQRGWSILKTTPYWATMILVLPLDLIEDLILFISEPRLLVYKRVERLCVDKKHVIAGTFRAKEWKDERSDVSLKMKHRLMDWQRKNR
jgi:hypothetical protein